MKLAIISHTEHYIDKDGTILGWGPTVREINHLTRIFDEIYHVAMLSDDTPPKSALPYTSAAIHFVSIPKVGGQTVVSKLQILLSAPKTLHIIKSVLSKVDYFQFRAPTGIGVYVIPYLNNFSKKPGWFKYAGNFNQKSAPMGYAIQKKLLINQKRKVTINGRWPNQPNHCLSFENPCLTEENRHIGSQVADSKDYGDKLTFCFVGRVEEQKGVDTILNAFRLLPPELHERIAKLIFVGEGKNLEQYRKESRKIPLSIEFTGALSNDQVFKIFELSHCLLLPTTASEGFPKVIAEALNFGCVPIVSKISSIGQYIKNGETGILLESTSVDCLLTTLLAFCNKTHSEIKNVIPKREQLVEKFTFSHYNNRIINDIIKS